MDKQQTVTVQTVVSTNGLYPPGYGSFMPPELVTAAVDAYRRGECSMIEHGRRADGRVDWTRAEFRPIPQEHNPTGVIV